MAVGVAIPVAGYPSRTAAILGLQRRGFSMDEIAARVGVPSYRVRYIASGRADVRNRPRRGVTLSEETVELLAEEAARRGCTPSEVADAMLLAGLRGLRQTQTSGDAGTRTG